MAGEKGEEKKEKYDSSIQDKGKLIKIECGKKWWRGKLRVLWWGKKGKKYKKSFLWTS